MKGGACRSTKSLRNRRHQRLLFFCSPGDLFEAATKQFHRQTGCCPDQEEASFSPADKLDNLSEEQKEEVEQQSRPNAALIHETIRAEGESELERTASAPCVVWICRWALDGLLANSSRRATCAYPRADNRDFTTFISVLRLLGLVLSANIVGTWLIAAATYCSYQRV